MHKKQKHIVILGAGFGGIYTLKYLRKYLKDEEFEVTVINRTDHFLFTPLLLEVATGSMSPSMVVEDLQETFGDYMDHFLQADVQEINTEEKFVTTSEGTVKYDYLVVALGSRTSFFGTPGAIENSFTLKDLYSAVKIRDHIGECFHKALTSKNDAEKRKLLSFVLIGAGASGVDLTIEIARYANFFAHKYPELRLDRYINVHIIDMMPTPLPAFSEHFQHIAKDALKKNGAELHLGQKVKQVTPDMVLLENGDEIPTITPIWVAGVKPNTPKFKNEVEHDKRGCLVVNKYLQLNDHPDIFVLGDMSHTIDPKTQRPLPMLAQVAIQQSKNIAYNLAILIKDPMPNKLKKFKYFSKGFLIPLGQWNGAGEILGIEIGGFIAWTARKILYLMQSLSWQQRRHMAWAWIKRSFTGRYINI